MLCLISVEKIVPDKAEKHDTEIQETKESIEGMQRLLLFIDFLLPVCLLNPIWSLH